MVGGYRTLRYEVADRVGRITLDRPEARNALSPEMTADLLDALERAKKDPQVRVVVLTGAGDRVFCAGADLGAMGRGSIPGQASGGGERAGEADAVDLFSAFPELGKPIIGRLAGHALAGGLGLACSCDLVVAADDVKLGTPEVNVGLWPMMIMAVVDRNVPPKQALKLYYTGRPVTAPEAVEIGLITEAVPRAELDRRVDELAAAIADKSPIGLSLGRDAYFTYRDEPLRDRLTYLARRFGEVAATDDAREGIAAFLEKRSPNFTGPLTRRFWVGWWAGR
ncbi:MAG: crotonase [Streptosporangiales bacterium]|nr:crotonase [Streptosporangiales bacterium]